MVLVPVVVQVVLARCPFTQCGNNFLEKNYLNIAVSKVKLRFSAVCQMNVFFGML